MPRRLRGFFVWGQLSPTHQGETKMNANLLNNYRAYLKAGAAMRAELAKILKGNQYLPDATVNALARVHAKYYEETGDSPCCAVQKESGAWVFYTTSNPEEQTRDNVHEAAKKQWARHIAPHHNYERKEAGVRHKKSEADKWIETYEKLPKATRRAITTYILAHKTV
jgi:hypothetical protein